MFQFVNSCVIGIDPSLNSLGYSYIHKNSLITGTIKPRKLKGVERLEFHYTAMKRIFETLGKGCLVVMEGYSMGSAGRGNNNVFKIGELGGVLKLLTFQSYNDMLIVPPKTLKLFIAGNGNADKDMVIQAIRDTHGNDFTGRDDEADAFGLMQMGIAYISRRKPRNATKLRALQNVEFIAGEIPF